MVSIAHLSFDKRDAMAQIIADKIREKGCYPGVGPYGEGWDIQQNPDEFGKFAAFCIGENVKTVLELGTGAKGGLARFMTEVLGWQVTSIDISKPDPLTPGVEFMQGGTMALQPYVSHRQFDMIFIDADHAYDAALLDWANYDHMARIVAFHDIAAGRTCCPGTIQLWKDLAYKDGALKSGYYEAIADTENAGIGWHLKSEQYVFPIDFREEWAKPLTPRNPDITVVSGTFNRLGYLQQMIESARAGVPRGITLDFVIVDGGSTDGSLDWLKQQPDVTLIEHGALLGAIKAFCDGSKAATGKYVVMANDDVQFIGDGLFKAFSHLETHNRCGAVAFAFDEPNAPGRFKINSQLYVDGETYSTFYAQVGMYPRWLGNACGWWGADDPAFPARTYGGDNYLTSRIIESGYDIEAVKGAEYHDLLAPDQLRQINNHTQLGNNHPDSQAWLDRFNGGLPVWRAYPFDRAEGENLRILYVPIYDGDSETKQRERVGWLRSLQKIGSVVEVDYRNYGAKHGQAALLNRLLYIIETMQPHLCITQVHTPDLLTAEMLVKMRNAAPSMVVINWNGDEYVPTDRQDGVDYMKLCDLQLIVNGTRFPGLVEHGIKTAFMFDSFQPIEPVEMPAHDVVFLGNAYRPERWDLEEALRSIEGIDLGLYGRGWETPNGDTLYHYSASHGLYTRAKLAIADNMYSDSYAYVSDRIFSALAYGQCVLWKACPGAEAIFGLVDGVHYIGWADLDDLKAKILHWLNPKQDKKRRAIGKAARTLMHKYHTYDARTRAMLEALERFVK